MSQTFPISIVQLISIENLKINWPQLINTEYQLNPIDIWFPIDINWTIWHQLRSNKHAFSLPDTTPSWIHSSHNVLCVHEWNSLMVLRNCCFIEVRYQLNSIDIRYLSIGTNWYSDFQLISIENRISIEIQLMLQLILETSDLKSTWNSSFLLAFSTGWRRNIGRIVNKNEICGNEPGS